MFLTYLNNILHGLNNTAKNYTHYIKYPPPKQDFTKSFYSESKAKELSV